MSSRLLLSAALVASCGGSQRAQTDAKPQRPPPLHLANRTIEMPVVVAATPAPGWVTSVAMQSEKLCGIGVAGAGYDANSPYPKELSAQRAARNLAGALETIVQEAIVDRATHRGQSVELARALHVDEALIEQIRAMATTEHWLDVAGAGPYAQKSFTYAYACIDAKVAASSFKIDPKMMKAGARPPAVNRPDKVPKWLKRTGKQPGGRLCAVGFSLPTFHPDKTFEVVVEDIRGQLAHVLETLVSSYTEELTTKGYQLYEQMTVASTQAISKGAIVTDFWYDRDGKGPNHHKRSTYGWGCIYPVDVMLKAVESVEQALPENVIQKVRERAEKAFDELDAEIEKREVRPAPRPAPAPTPEPTPAAPMGPAASAPPSEPPPAP